MNGISVLIKGHPESFSSLSLYEKTVWKLQSVNQEAFSSLFTLWRHSVKMLSVKQEVGFHLHWIWQHFDFGLTSLQNVEDKCLLFISHQLYGIFF